MSHSFWSTTSSVLFWFAFALYVGATVLYAYQFVLRRQKTAWWARFATGAGFILQTLSIGAGSVAHGGTIYTGSNQLILASWALVLMYFAMEHLLRIRAYGAFLIPVAVVVMTMAQLRGGTTVSFQQQSELVKGFAVAFHVAMIVFANAGFTVGAVTAMLYLFQESQLKRHRTSIIGRRLPSLASLQNVSRRAIALSLPIYTAGLTMGVIQAILKAPVGWYFDPRIMLAGLVFLTFSVYMALIYRHDVSSRATAWVAIVGFVFVIVTAIVARTLPVGFHVFGQM